MESKLSTNPLPPGRADRRSGIDRRKADVQHVGKDRRRGVESRQPEVVELDMSSSEWMALNQDPPKPAR
jgi:hypothetical protein